MNMVSPIDVLESRISELEIQVYGKIMKSSVDGPFPDSTILDNLLHVNTLISSALSGREKTNALVTRLPELNEYLDMSNRDDDLQTESKLELLLTMEQDFHRNQQLVDKIQENSAVLNTDDLKYLPELTPNMENLTLNYLEYYEKSNEITNEIREMFSKYDSIIHTISKSMISMDAVITAAETKTKNTKEEEK